MKKNNSPEKKAASCAKKSATIKARNAKENKARKTSQKWETPQQNEDRATRANLAEVRKSEGKKPKGPATRKPSKRAVKSGSR